MNWNRRVALVEMIRRAFAPQLDANELALMADDNDIKDPAL